MKAVKKISDLVINETYYLLFVNDGRFAKKIKLLGIINENVEYNDVKRTELYFETAKSRNLAFFGEIGIGKTKLEAKSNYGKFKYENNELFSDSYEKVKSELISNYNMYKPYVYHRIS